MMARQYPSGITVLEAHLVKTIKGDHEYTLEEVRAMRGFRQKKTIYNWRTMGLRTKRHGIVYLRTTWNGSRPMVLGWDLIDFLVKTQREDD